MPSLRPILPFLRPLAAPRAPTCQHLVRFSTSRGLRADERQPKTPAQPTTSEEASRAADIAAAEANTESDSAQAPASKPTLPSKRTGRSRSPKASKTAAPTASEPSSDAKPTTTQAPKPKEPRIPKLKIELAPPRYHVERSLNKNLPVYTDYKRGGNLHLTTVRKVTGDLTSLRDELRVFLNKKEGEVKVNSLTQHVIVKGHHKLQITGYLKARGM